MIRAKVLMECLLCQTLFVEGNITVNHTTRTEAEDMRAAARDYAKTVHADYITHGCLPLKGADIIGMAVFVGIVSEEGWARQQDFQRKTGNIFLR